MFYEGDRARSSGVPSHTQSAAPAVAAAPAVDDGLAVVVAGGAHAVAPAAFPSQLLEWHAASQSKRRSGWLQGWWRLWSCLALPDQEHGIPHGCLAL